MTAPQLATAFRLPPNPHLRRLAEALPGYQLELELIAAADAWLANMQPIPPVPFGETPAATGEFSQEWLDKRRAYTKAVDDQKTDRTAVINEKQQAQSRATSEFATSINHLLSELNQELQQHLAEFDNVARQLNGATTAEQAIKLDVAPQRKHASEIADRIESLYSASEWLYVTVAPQTYWHSIKPALGADDWCTLGRITNITDLAPNYRNPLAAQRQNIDGTKTPAEPWPTEPTDRLLWLRRNGAALEIKTLPQLDQLFRQMRDALNPPQAQDPPRQVLNRPPRAADDNYYSRVAMPLDTARPPTELTEIGAEA